MMKKICLIVMVVMNCVAVFGQTPNWQWAKSARTGIFLPQESSCNDINGNLLVTGIFQSDSITFGSITLINSGSSQEIFVVKYDTWGNVLWAKSAEGNSFEKVKSICSDVNGNVLVTGSFGGGSITFDTTTLTNINFFEDFFVVKYDSSGNLMWAKLGGGTHNDEASSISTDVSGNVFVTGFFNSDSMTLGSTTLITSGNYDVFVVKYDVSGNVIWVKSAGGADEEKSESISIDANGNVLIAGWFRDSSITFDNIIFFNAGDYDIFIAKYDSSGNLLWAKQAGGIYDDEATSICTDANGNVIVTGFFTQDSITFGSTTLISSVNNDIFVVKYDSLGTVVWAKSEGGIINDMGQTITSDASGNLFLTGNFNSPSITFGSTTLTNASLNDIFVVKYDASGSALWAKWAGGANYDFAYGISIDASGNVFISGDFTSPTLTFGSTTLTNNGPGDSYIFIAKLGTTTGIEEQNNSIVPITLYPNPTTSQLNITNPYPIDKIEITNVIGQLIYSATPKEKSVEVELKQQGVYFVTGVANNQTFTKKVVVQR